MFEDFLRLYVKDYIECGDYDDDICMSDSNIDTIASRVNDNEYLWETIDMCINNEIEKVLKEDD